MVILIKSKTVISSLIPKKTLCAQRLNRNVKDFCQFWDFAQRYNVKLISLKENFDTSTPAGEMMLLSIMNFAQFERKNIVQRIKSGSRSRAERGLSGGGVPILGYDSHPDKTCHRVVNEKEKSIVQLIFKTFMSLGTMKKTANYLNDKGYKTKEIKTKTGKIYGGNRWVASSMHRTLTNLTYIGKRELNKRSRHLDQSTLKDDETYKVYDAQWPGIISEKLFYSVQQLLEDNKEVSRHNIHNYRLRGFAHCKECGEKLIGKSGISNGIKYQYYGHKRKKLNQGSRHLERCVLENIPALAFEEAVMSALKRLKNDKELLKSLIIERNKGTAQNSSYLDGLLQSLRERHKSIRDKAEGLISAIAEAPKAKSTQTLILKLDELEQEKEVLEKEMENLSQERKKTSSNLVNLNSAFSLLSDFNKNFEKLTPHKQKMIMQNIVNRVYVARNGVYIECHGMTQTPKFELHTEVLESHLAPKILGNLENSKDKLSRSKIRASARLVEQK